MRSTTSHYPSDRATKSYRVELQSFAVKLALGSGHQEPIYYNKAVVDHALHLSHRQCSDMDLRLTIQEEPQNKPLRSRWVPSHRDIAKVKTKEERTDIKRNDEVGLAKIATGLPLPEYTPTHPGDIAVNGGPAPTLAKKWVIERKHYDLFSGTHWVSWLLGKGTRRMTWVKWLWRNEQWDGCGVPWDHNVVKCSMCNTRHGTDVHKQLIQCPKWVPSFQKAWTHSWGTWAEYAAQWYDKAFLGDMHHVARFRIPSAFYDQLSEGYGPHFSEHVGHHQYMMLHTVYQLRKEFTMPRRDNEEPHPSQSASAWYGKVKPKVCASNFTPQGLQQQVMHKPRKQKCAKVNFG